MREGKADLGVRLVAGICVVPGAVAAVRATRRLRLRLWLGAGPIGAVGSCGLVLASGLVPAAGFTR